LGYKTKNRAVGARFWLGKCRRASLEVEGTPLGWGTLRLRCREGAIGSGARGGLFGLKNQKPSCGGSVLASEMQAGLIWGRGDPIGAGYAGVEVLGGRGPRLWSPRSWSPPHLRPPLVPRCPLPLTSLDPQLTYCHSFNPLALGLCSLDLVCLQLVPIRARSTSRGLGVPVCPCLRLLLPFLLCIPLRIRMPSRWPLVRVCPPCARLFCL